MKKFVIQIDDSYHLTKEELDEIERDFHDFLHNDERSELALGPGVTLTVIDVDPEIPTQLVVDCNRVKKAVETIWGNMPVVPPGGRPE